MAEMRARKKAAAEMAHIAAMTPEERTEHYMAQSGFTYGGAGGERGQTIGDYFSGIKRKRDEDRRRAAARHLARVEEEEWLGVAEEEDPELAAWKSGMLAKGWIEISENVWISPEEAERREAIRATPEEAERRGRPSVSYPREETTWSPW